MSLPHDELSELTDQALDAFWQVICHRFPQAKSGDLGPWPTIQLQIAAEKAVEEWIDNNVPVASKSRTTR
jgi:hypothetical protein